jgi:hypothetical protein
MRKRELPPKKPPFVMGKNEKLARKINLVLLSSGAKRVHPQSDRELVYQYRDDVTSLIADLKGMELRSETEKDGAPLRCNLISGTKGSVFLWNGPALDIESGAHIQFLALTRRSGLLHHKADSELLVNLDVAVMRRGATAFRRGNQNSIGVVILGLVAQRGVCFHVRQSCQVMTIEIPAVVLVKAKAWPEIAAFELYMPIIARVMP